MQGGRAAQQFAAHVPFTVSVRRSRVCPEMSMLTFNMADGFAEGIVRGFRSGFLSEDEYHHLTQCESIEGTGSDTGISPRHVGAVALACLSRAFPAL